MASLKLIKSGLAALLSVVALTACTPPMPPEFKAELAERYVTCSPGALSVSAPVELSEIAQTWIDGLSENCSEFTGTLVDSAIPADVTISLAGATPPCTVASSAPVGLDAVAVSVTVDGLDGVVFSPALLYKALSGQMTSWADPELQELNPDLSLTDTPVILRPSVRTPDLAALNEWMSRLDPQGWPGTPSGLVPNDLFDPEMVATEIEAEGTISVLPASFATSNSIPSAAIQAVDGEDAVLMNIDTIISAGTQITSQLSGSTVTATLDPSLAPIPAPGLDVAQAPWQALNQYKISVCSGANEMVGRAFARFSLRLDSQGALTLAGFTELPESVRVAGVDAVSQGLPEPTIPPSDAPASSDVATEEAVPTDEATPMDMPTEVPTDEATPEPTS